MNNPQHALRLRANDQDDAATRGTLSISEKAIEKIAGQVAASVPGIHGTSGGFLGIGARSDEDARPKVKVNLSGVVATLQISAGVRYPWPLRATTERLRSEVLQKVGTSCGIEVVQVDIDIETLVATSASSGKRELL